MKRNIAIIAGGDSSEYEVSLRSAKGILSFMDQTRYNVTIVRLHGHDWCALPDADIEHDDLTSGGIAIDRNDFSYMYHGEKRTFDFAYITIHGTSTAHRARTACCKAIWT